MEKINNVNSKLTIKAIIFDWGRTLFDSMTKKEFPDALEVLEYCKEKGYALACASLVTSLANASLSERKNQIETSPLRHFFEYTAVTDGDKDEILDELVSKLGFSRAHILIVDDRIIRGVKYGNLRGHPTVWLQNGKFANELPNEETKEPTFIIHSLKELRHVI